MLDLIPETRVKILLQNATFISRLIKTRMHSSRMRTGRSLTVCGRLLPRGVAWSGGSSAPGGPSAPGGAPGPGGSALGGGGSGPGGGFWHPSMH